TTFRMLLLGATSRPRRNSASLAETFMERIDLTGLTVLDPFMGGGTTLVEAAKCGANVIGIDIDPVACFLTRKELEPIPQRDLDEAFDAVSQRVRERITQRYVSRMPSGDMADIIYSFW